jgi:hypothetical protein
MIETTKKEIENLFIRFSDTVYDKIETAEETYCVDDDAKDLLYKIGLAINNHILIEMFKKPKTIEEIVAEIKKGKSIEDFEELEEIESERDADSEPKYIYLYEIMKHIPTGKFYRFSTQIYKDDYSEPEFMGEVIPKEITTIQWVKK